MLGSLSKICIKAIVNKTIIMDTIMLIWSFFKTNSCCYLDVFVIRLETNCCAFDWGKVLVR